MPERDAIYARDEPLPGATHSACCPGACGPIFETPLAEVLFKRIRDVLSTRWEQPRTQRMTRPRPGKG